VSSPTRFAEMTGEALRAWWSDRTLAGTGFHDIESFATLRDAILAERDAEWAKQLFDTLNERDALRTRAERAEQERDAARADERLAVANADRMTDEVAGFEAMWEAREKAHDAALGEAKREIEHWVLDRRAELGPQPNLSKSDSERYAWAGKMTAYDAVLAHVTGADVDPLDPATPSGEGVTQAEPCLEHNAPRLSCHKCRVWMDAQAQAVRATPQPEAIVVPCEVNLTGRDWSPSGDYRITITAPLARRLLALAQTTPEGR
jgi:hypothetical protein